MTPEEREEENNRVKVFNLRSWYKKNVGKWHHPNKGKVFIEKWNEMLNKATECRLESEKIVLEWLDSMDRDELVQMGRGTELSPITRSERLEFILEGYKNGRSDVDLSKEFNERYGLKENSTAYYKFKNQALKLLDTYTLKDAEAIRNKQVYRLELILNKTIEKGDYKTANSIIETMNKLCNLYDKKADVVVAPVMQFKFDVDDSVLGQEVNKKVMSVVSDVAQMNDVKDEVLDTLYDEG